MMPNTWNWRRSCLILAAIPAAFLVSEVLRMGRVGRTALFDSIDLLPQHRVGLLLGCIPRMPDGRANLYFVHRVEAAARLFHANKIEYVIASGDAAREGQDEPAAMRQALVERGVPDSRILIDARGLRTLDSVVRAKLVFGLRELTLISQRFHNERAMYIAHSVGLSVVGFNARDPSASVFDKMRWREPFARLLAVLDARVFDTQPRFVEERIRVPD